MLPRPHSEFDSGINTSNAWTEHLERGELSLSDEERDGEKSNGGSRGRGRLARALYDFEGLAEFQELSVIAGDALTVLKEELADGWSLAKCKGEVGLIPRTYYIVSKFNYGVRRNERHGWNRAQIVALD